MRMCRSKAAPQFSAPLNEVDRTKVVLMRESGILELKRSVIKVTLSVKMLLHDVEWLTVQVSAGSRRKVGIAVPIQDCWISGRPTPYSEYCHHSS